MEKIDELLGAYADLPADESATGELARWLSAEDAHVDRFVRETFLHWHLFEVARRRLLQANVVAAPEDDALLASALRAGAYRAPGAVGTAKTNGRRTFLAIGLAAALALAAWPVRVAYIAMRQPAVVAQITRTSADARWADARRPVAGQFVRKDQSFNIERGRAVITLASGAQIGVEGPAAFCIKDENVVRLDSGRLSGVAPSQATGFAVETTAGRVVDLGTEFTLCRDSPHVLRLFVFEGLVEIQPSTSAGGKPIRVSESSGVSFDAQTGEITKMPFDGIEMLAP